MRKPRICICEIKVAVTAYLTNAFVFATRMVQFLYFLNTKFPASSYLLCLHRPICVGPVRKPHYWFSHEAAHLYLFKETLAFCTFPNKLQYLMRLMFIVGVKYSFLSSNCIVLLYINRNKVDVVDIIQFFFSSDQKFKSGNHYY